VQINAFEIDAVYPDHFNSGMAPGGFPAACAYLEGQKPAARCGKACAAGAAAIHACMRAICAGQAAVCR
jgi:acetyl-CoA acetyltransferase